MEVLNDLVGFDNLKIYQNTNMFNFSLDSVLLPNFVTIKKNMKKVLDIGCGNAPIPLILSTKINAHIDAVEIQKDVFELALKTVRYNNLENQISLFNDDINELYKKLDVNSYDLITCNPPFFKVHDNSRINSSEYKTIARHEIKLNLDQICKISSVLLKDNASLGIVHRPNRMVDIIEAMKKNNIEPKRIRFVYPFHDKEANCILIEGTKNGKNGVKIFPPLYVHDNNLDYSKEVKEMFR